MVATALDAVLEFSKTRDPWQQDLIRRIVTSADLADQDFREVLASLKARFGLDHEPVAEPQPLTSAHLPDHHDDAAPVLLNSVGNVVNANRLATGQLLPFGLKGLTVIYGENGSGKSGYCRILKKVCRVREGGEEKVRGNAFDVESVALPAEATVRFTTGTDPVTEVRWKDGASAPPDLARISVFDARTVSLYADQQNRVEFLPQGLDVMSRLGEVCERLARTIEAEKTGIEQRIAISLPSVPAATSAAALLAQLTKTVLPQDLPTEEQITAQCTWTDEDQRTLDTTEDQIRSDPEVQATRCRRLGQVLQDLQQTITHAEQLLDDEAVQRYRSAITDSKAAREAATLAAKEAAGTDLLPGFGSDPWRLLYEHARRYSAISYPGVSFPVTAADARCVLCQQPLTVEAHGRFQRFEDYVKSAAESHARHTEEARDKEKLRVASLHLRTDAELSAACAGLTDEETTGPLTPALSEYLHGLRHRQTAILEGFEHQTLEAPAPLPTTPRQRITDICTHLQTQATLHDTHRDPTTRRALETKRDNLIAQKTLSASRPALLRRREDLDTLSRLTASRAACETKSISLRNTELRKLYLTKDFHDRLFREIRTLDLEHIPFKIQEKSDHAASYIGIGLESVIHVRNHEILSDGEFRALAIACFLTEISGIPSHNGIIIDDPVSSLDHERTRIVADRLVREATDRQVIVFTHDMVFYHELYQSAAQRDVPVVRHWVRRTQEFGFGTIMPNEDPWQAKKVKDRLAELDKRLAILRSRKDLVGDEYRKAVGDIYTDLRETWERLVEELLFNNVVTRFQLGVKTLSLAGVEVTNEDYKRVFFGMARASTCSGHDKPQAAQASTTSPDDIQADIDSLRKYMTELIKRREKLQGSRRELEKPGPGKTA